MKTLLCSGRTSLFSGQTLLFSGQTLLFKCEINILNRDSLFVTYALSGFKYQVLTVVYPVCKARYPTLCK